VLLKLALLLGQKARDSETESVSTRRLVRWRRSYFR
jgi:hypothetical protein